MKKSFLGKFCRYFVFVVLFWAAAVQGQSPSSFTVSGYVYEAGSLETLIGVTVYETNSKAGVLTNSYGFYSLTIPAGPA